MCITLITTFYVHNYPLSDYYVLYTCQCQYLLNYGIHTYLIFCQISTGAMDQFLCYGNGIFYADANLLM